MSELTTGTAQNWLLNRISDLEHEGNQVRIEINMTKVFSFGMFTASGLLAFASVAGAAALAVPVAVAGAAFYLPSLLHEGKATGGLRPLPFSSTSLTTMLSQVDRSTRGMMEDEHHLDGYAYLQPLEKAEYALINYLGETLAPALEVLEPRERSRVWRRAVRLISQHFGDELKTSPYALEHHSKQVLQDFALSPDKHRALVAGPVDEPLEEPSQPPRAIGTNTRFGAIPVKAIEATTDEFEDASPWVSTEPMQAATSSSKPQIDPFCDVRSLAQTGYIESVIWIGASRSGKTIAADQLFQEYKQVYPALKTWYITPVYRAGTDANELSLFQGATVKRYDLLNETNQEIISECYAEYERVLEEFLQAESDRQHPKLFICDELSIHRLKAFPNPKTNYLGNAVAQRFYGKYINAIAANASGGKAVGIGLWGIAPIGAVGGLGLEQYTLSATTPVFIGHVDSWNGAVWKGAKRNALAPETEPTEDFKRNVKRLGGDRVVSIGCADWRPLKRYTVAAGKPKAAVASTKKELPSTVKALLLVVNQGLEKNGSVNTAEIQRYCGSYDAGKVLQMLVLYMPIPCDLILVGGVLTLVKAKSEVKV